MECTSSIKLVSDNGSQQNPGTISVLTWSYHSYTSRCDFHVLNNPRDSKDLALYFILMCLTVLLERFLLGSKSVGDQLLHKACNCLMNSRGDFNALGLQATLVA